LDQRFPVHAAVVLLLTNRDLHPRFLQYCEPRARNAAGNEDAACRGAHAHRRSPGRRIIQQRRTLSWSAPSREPSAIRRGELDNLTHALTGAALSKAGLDRL